MRAVLETPWFSVEALPSRDDDEPYYVLSSPDGVVVLPITEDGRYLLIRQYRAARGRLSLEAPAGQIDAGETPEQAARRELLEETGCTASDMIALGAGGLALNRERSKVHLFLALGVRPEPGARPETGIALEPVDADELRDKVLSGECEHIAALGLITLAAWRGHSLPGLTPGDFRDVR
ncbi:NUDIX hydrolase [uncultured Alphaproteobacteria bacterium]|uniref:GDP-mannose pyrophosphatase n=1 Tax=uncultured Alphaproteobacteria bacterium TaxID=91750 RepID=A0A212JPW2_9PROT|nr:NUDIX hydrolase [uncultured Alphaproteobacteria bacterium]